MFFWFLLREVQVVIGNALGRVPNAIAVRQDEAETLLVVCLGDCWPELPVGPDRRVHRMPGVNVLITQGKYRTLKEEEMHADG